MPERASASQRGTTLAIAIAIAALVVLLAPVPAAGQDSIGVGALPPRAVELQPRALAHVPRVLDIAPRREGRTRTVPSDVLFAFGSATLSPDAQAVLTGVATEVAKARGTVLITGHTDSIGDANSNLTLSLRRARAVRDLLALTAKNTRFQVQGRGETEPTTRQNQTQTQHDDPEARRRDRRVTITLPRDS